MFHRKHLKNEEIAQLVNMREKYIAAFKERSDKGPAEFEANIACLKQLRMVSNMWGQVMEPHLKKGLNKIEYAFQHFISLVGMIIANKVAYSKSKIVKEAQKIVFTPELNEVIKTEFAKEPRITGLNYYENNDHTEKTNNGHHETIDTHIVNCVITFSDGTNLNFHSLEDEQELSRAKELFENKMQELAPKHALGLLMR